MKKYLIIALLFSIMFFITLWGSFYLYYNYDMENSWMEYPLFMTTVFLLLFFGFCFISLFYNDID